MADYYIEEILGGRGTLEEDRDKLREAVAFLGRLDDAVDRNLFVKKVAEQLDVDEEVLKAEVRRGLSHAPRRRPSAAAKDRFGAGSAGAEPDPDDAGISGGGSRSLRESGVLDCFRTEELKGLGEALWTWKGRERRWGTSPPW